MDFVFTGRLFDISSHTRKANKAADELSTPLHSPEMTKKWTYSHSSSSEENELNVQIKEVASITEYGNQSTNSSNNKCVPKQGGKNNWEKSLLLHHRAVNNAQHFVKKCKEIIDALLSGDKLAPIQNIYSGELSSRSEWKNCTMFRNTWKLTRKYMDTVSWRCRTFRHSKNLWTDKETISLERFIQVCSSLQYKMYSLSGS